MFAIVYILGGIVILLTPMSPDHKIAIFLFNMLILLAAIMDNLMEIKDSVKRKY